MAKELPLRTPEPSDDEEEEEEEEEKDDDPWLEEELAILEELKGKSKFFIACTRLYNPLCRSVLLPVPTLDFPLFRCVHASLYTSELSNRGVETRAGE